MDLPPDEARSRSFETRPRRPRRFSIWTVIAPAAVVVLFVAVFSALGSSCVLKECGGSDEASAETTDEPADKRNEVKAGGKAKVKAGDSLGSIAARFDLTEAELKACNPKVDPQALQPGNFLVVSAINCEEADTAEVGADPDPFAGEVTGAGSVPDPAANGTAAADPSADAAPADTAAADQGDEG